MITSKKIINTLSVNYHENLKNCVKKLNKNELKILFILNENDQLIGTFSDGDLRRALLNGHTFEDRIYKVMNKKFISSNSTNIAKKIFNKLHLEKIDYLPILDQNKKIQSIFVLSEKRLGIIDNPLVIMAGGYGKRLMPFTKDIPKSLVKVGTKPMLERIINNAKIQGFYNIYISIYYKGEKIKKYFGNGRKYGVKIKYINEKKPLGTIGSLSYLQKTKYKDLIVTNCDVITDINYLDILNFHINQKSNLTVAFKKHKTQNPYGVIDINRNKVIGFKEKPIMENNVNAGVYVFNRKAINLMKKNFHYDFPDLLDIILRNKDEVFAFPVYENWIDVGNKTDLQKASKKLDDR